MTKTSYDFSDVQAAVRIFTGDDTFSVTKWLSDFEDTAAVSRLDDRMKFLFAKKLIDGTAKLVVQMSKPTDWPQLNMALM